MRISINQRGYYATRIVFLASSLFFLFLWALFGFDSTLENIDGSNPYGFGMHISTIQAASMIFYFSFVNLNVGGFKSRKHLISEIKIDLRTLWGFKINYGAIMNYPVKAWRFQFMLDIMYSGFLVLIAGFAFEIPYVFMLNYFQYNSLMFPVFMYKGGEALLRNLFFLLVPIGWCMIYPLFFRSRAKYRIDRLLALFILITSLVWLGWIIYPSQMEYKSPDDIDLNIEPLTWPNQKLFPQTIYAYLNVTMEEGNHSRKNIDAWHNDDPPVHLLNVLTKYMVFLSVGYLFMVKIEK